MLLARRYNACAANFLFVSRALCLGLALLPNLLDYLRPNQPVQARSRWDEAGVDIFVGERWLALFVDRGDGRLKPLAILLFKRVAPGFRLPAAFGGVFGVDAGHLKRRFVVSSTAFVAGQSALNNRFGDREHVS
jgi:hypothetical protein